MSEREARSLVDAAARAARDAQGEALRSKHFEVEVHGARCIAHAKFRLARHRPGAGLRYAGECWVYLSSPECGETAGGLGGAQFVLAEPALAHAWRLIDLALAEARDALLACPVFVAFAERQALSEAAPAAAASPATRPRARL